MNPKPEEQKREDVILTYINETEECEQEELYYKLWEDDRL